MPVVLPPYTPPRPRIPCSSSPPVPLDDLLRGAASAPVGCELIVCGVLPAPGISAAETVRNAIKAASTFETESTVRILDTELFKVLVSPPGPRADRETYCYVCNAADVAQASNVPRPDLLERWISILTVLNNEWTVGWSPQRGGKDKSHWVALHGIAGLEKKSKSEFSRLVSSEIERLGFPVVSSFSMNEQQRTSAGVILRHLADIHRITRASPLICRALSPEPISAFANFRQVEPAYAFELAILGVGDYDPSFCGTLDSFFIHCTKDSEGSDSSAFVCSRMIPEYDAYCFVMRDWSAVSQVLAATQPFEDFMKRNRLNLQPPQLVYELNSNNLWKVHTTTIIRKAGDDVIKRLDELDSKIEDLRQEQSSQFNAVDRRFALLEEGASQLLMSVKELSTEMGNSRRALLAQHSRSRMSDRIHSNCRRLDRIADELKFEENAETRQELKDEAKALLKENKEMEENVGLEDDLVKANLGLPTILPPPANNPSNPGTVTTTPLTPSATSPTAPSTPLPTPKQTPAKPKPIAPPSKETKKQRRSSRGAGKVANQLEITTGGEMSIDDDEEGQVAETDGSPHVPKRQKRTNDEVMDVELANRKDSEEKSMENALCSMRTPTVRLSGIWSCSGSDAVFSVGLWLNGSSFSLPLRKDSSNIPKWPNTDRKSTAHLNALLNMLQPRYLIIIVFLFILCPVSCLAVSAPKSGLSIYALNANGMNNVLKLQHINTAVRARNPSVFVISELKSKTSVVGKMPGDAYNILKEKSEPTDGTWKWGLLIGIRKDIQIAQWIQITERMLKARVIAVDILLPSTDGRGFAHRIFGVYAPWDPGLKTAFWERMTNLCNNCPHDNISTGKGKLGRPNGILQISA